MATLNANGTTFEYAEQGDGDPVVLVHGSASDYRTWQVQLDQFGESYRTIAYSRRYHWPNERIPEGVDYSMDEHVDDLQEFLRELGVGPVHLVGHSYGGFLALLLVMRDPSLVRTLVLAEPPVMTLFVSDPPKPSELLKLFLRAPRTAVSIMKLGVMGLGPATAAARKGDMETATRLFGRAVLGPEFSDRLSESRLEQVAVNSFAAEFLGSGFAPLDDEDLRRIQTPTLLVGGQRSPRVFDRLLDRLEVLLPHTERIEIPGASHAIHEDNASAFGEAVLSFLAKHKAA